MTAEVQVQEEVVRRDEPLEDGHASEVPSEEVAPQKENGIEAPSPPAEEPTTKVVETPEEAPPAPASNDASNHRKVMSMTQIDRDGLRDAYSDVRDDKSEINWAVFKYEGSQVVVAAKGETFDDFKSQFGEDERAFAYLRLQTGDEMSKRAKFLLLTWVGLGVSPIKKAKMSTDKALVKEILANFAVELTLESTGELDHDAFLQELVKAGGANYGTGVRD